jgi:hypothetical protein
MNRILFRLSLLALAMITGSACSARAQGWTVHSMERPKPPVVDPGPARPPAPPPADAFVLFDGTGLDAWEQASDSGRPAEWKVESGYMEVVPGRGAIRTRRAFGDLQLHIEWAAPVPPTRDGQNRGNSGVFFMSRYEVQVLDSWQNETYADGQAAALYGQYPPLVNATRPPGQWQAYDIVFRRPRFDSSGKLRRPARVTVIHNGVLVHDAVSLKGATAHAREATYEAHPDRLPLLLQDHDSPVRFRNIWVRELAEE